jgi:hypothetical protein
MPLSRVDPHLAVGNKPRIPRMLLGIPLPVHECSMLVLRQPRRGRRQQALISDIWHGAWSTTRVVSRASKAITTVRRYPPLLSIAPAPLVWGGSHLRSPRHRFLLPSESRALGAGCLRQGMSGAGSPFGTTPYLYYPLTFFTSTMPSGICSTNYVLYILCAKRCEQEHSRKQATSLVGESS